MIFRSLMTAAITVACYLSMILPSAHARVEVIDDTGVVVVLEQHAQRIVSLSPHITENLFAAGLGDRIVATVAHADYPEPAKDLPRVGGYNSLNLEALIQLQADLIITWGSGISYESKAKLDALGIPIYTSEPKTLEDIQDNIKDFVKLGGLAEQEVSVLYTLDRVLAEFPRRKATATVFYQIWNDPIQTLNGLHIVNDVFARCGLYNVFAEAPSVARSACNVPAVWSSLIVNSRVITTGPLSSPASITIMLTPVSLSPASIARCIGAAPRHLGRSDACTLMQPSRGIASTAAGRISP